MGHIDEVKVYNVALSASEVQEDHTSSGAGGKCRSSLKNCFTGTKCDSDTRRCVPLVDNMAIGTYCTKATHCDTERGFFEFTCDKKQKFCVGAGHNIDCSDSDVNTNPFFGKLEQDVPRGDRCGRSLNCILDENEAGECTRDIGTEFVQDVGVGKSTDDIRDQIRRVINIVLGFLGVVGVIVVIYGGVLWMTSAGDEEKVDKGKKTIIAGVIGIIIIGIAWTIVSYVLNITQSIGQ